MLVVLADHAQMLSYRPIPNQLGTEFNLHILESFAKHVAPELGWKPNTEGPVEGDAA